MKTLNQINNEIASKQKHLDSKEFAKLDFDTRMRETKKITKEILLLRDIQKYLELNPREDFCKSEKARLERLLQSADKEWSDYYNRPENKEYFDKLPSSLISEKKKEYLKEVPLALYRKQLKTLSILLQ